MLTDRTYHGLIDEIFGSEYHMRSQLAGELNELIKR